MCDDARDWASVGIGVEQCCRCDARQRGGEEKEKSTRTPHRSHGSRTDLHFSTPRGAWAIFDRICSGRPSWTPGAPAVAVIAARASRRESRMAVQCIRVRGQKRSDFKLDRFAHYLHSSALYHCTANREAQCYGALREDAIDLELRIRTHSPSSPLHATERITPHGGVLMPFSACHPCLACHLWRASPPPSRRHPLSGLRRP